MKKLVALIAVLLVSPVSADSIKPRTVTTQAVIENGDYPFLMFPVVGSVQGGGGTFFRSDVMIANFSPTPQRILLGYFPRGNQQGEAGIINREVTLAANSFRTFRDIVGTLFNTSGLGSISLLALSATGQPQPDARLDGSARIYTQQPGSAGTVSQLLVAVAIGATSGPNTACGLGLRQDSGFRTNVGIVNFSATPRSFRIDAAGTGGTTTTSLVTVPAFSMDQAALPAGTLGDASVCVTPDTSTLSNTVWIAYATSVDNITGDSWATLLSQ